MQVLIFECGRLGKTKKFAETEVEIANFDCVKRRAMSIGVHEIFSKR